MDNRNTFKGAWWERLRSFMKSHTSLTVIIAAALLLELTTGVMYYSAQNIIQRTVERLVQREMNAIYLCIRNKLAKVEVTMDNMAWVVNEGLDEPDWMFDITQRMVKNNPSFMGSGVAFVPNYYPNKDKYFEPYAVRRGQDSIQSMQLGNNGVDHTQDDYFHVPVTQEKAHWSEPYFDNDGAKAIITTYGVPVRDSKSRVVGVVYADIALDWLDDVMNEKKAYKSTQRFLVTGNYNLLAGDDCGIFRSALEKLKADDDKKGYVELDDEHGNKKHVYFTPVGGMTKWMLVSVLDDGDVYRKLRVIRLLLLLPVMIGLFFAGFIVYRSSRNLERLRKVNAEKERIGSELRVASQIQQSMLPHSHMQHDNLDIFGSLVPAREVGGDLFDYYIRDEKLFFCIGDVSGKGVPSALVMSVIHSLFRAFSAQENNLARIMQAINEASCQGNDSNIFVTLFIGMLDLQTGHLRYCDAGHDVPIIIKDGKVRTVDCMPHLPVGVFDDMKYGVQDTNLEPDSTIFLYTDGLTEAKNIERKMFGLNRVKEVLVAYSQLQPQRLIEAVSNQVHKFVGDAEQSDDLTMLAIRYTPTNFKSMLAETLQIKNDVHVVSNLSETN